MAGFAEIFSSHAGDGGALTFARFMALALYHPEAGYYRRAGPRVGYGPGTDFYTASTSGAVFGELVAAACVNLLGASPAREFTFVEIGAEPGAGVLAGADHPFAAVRTLRFGDALDLPAHAVIFSNELFDAQPFHRLVFTGGTWRELGVAQRGGALGEVILPALSPEVSGHARLLPATAPEGYHLDLPLAAVALAEKIAAASWRGLFLAFDYGKSWAELSEFTPGGTVRAYHRHAQSNDLLARPGEQDLTGHICWDWMQAALARHRFATPTVVSQEAFFIRHAADAIAALAQAEAPRLSRRKLSLLQLLHPGHLGQKFQALSARRE